MLRTAGLVEAGRPECQLAARRVLREEGAILEEAMFSCTGSVCMDEQTNCRLRAAGDDSALCQQDDDNAALHAPFNR
jgi:hypothetical protein